MSKIPNPRKQTFIIDRHLPEDQHYFEINEPLLIEPDPVGTWAMRILFVIGCIVIVVLALKVIGAI